MTAATARTLIINPEPEQKLLYRLLEKAFIELVSELKPGAIVSDIYKKIFAVFTSDGKTPEFLKEHLGPHFGYGTGFKHHDLSFAISETNNKVIQAGNAFFA